METVQCSYCGCSMPKERLECYTTCIKCTNEQPYMGYTNISHKTSNETILIKPKNENKEAIRRAERVNKRAR